ncbi:MAG: hypothetical protein R3B84_20455 [Zavarzinella sp.]
MTESDELLRKFQLDRPRMDDEGLVQNPGYGFVRGIRDRAMMLDCQWKSGNRQGFSYHWLSRVELDLSGIVRLSFGPIRIELRGTHLTTIYQLAIQQRLVWIREQDPIREQVSSTDTVIEQILVME